MGDKSKLKTGNLGINAMEEKKLDKYLNTLDKQIRDKVTNSERQQKLLAKNFQERLHKSVVLARKQEKITFNLLETRGSSSHSDKVHVKDICLKKRPQGEVLKTDGEGVASSSSLLLRKWNQSFQVPYQKEYSFTWLPNTKPSAVLEARCKMWQKISEFCLTGRERARSAPPWLRELRGPKQIQRAHSQALEMMEIQRSLVQAPSRQPLIDIQKVRSWREKENKIAACAVNEFGKSVVPYKLIPGPSQKIHDVNSFYQLLSIS